MRIEITVSPTGQTTVQTRGFAGSSCQAGSRFIEQALGEKVAEQPTAEMYLPATTAVHQSQRT
jgi:hypothetical protein